MTTEVVALRRPSGGVEQLPPGPIPDARGTTNAARQRIRLAFDDGGDWTDLRLGRAWAVRLPRREIAHVDPARAPGLAGSTLLGSEDARAEPRHSGAPAKIRITRRLGQPGASGPNQIKQKTTYYLQYN